MSWTVAGRLDVRGPGPRCLAANRHCEAVVGGGEREELVVCVAVQLTCVFSWGCGFS